MRFPKSIKFRLNLWYLLIMLAVVLFFSATSYFMLDRNIFYRTYTPIKLAAMNPVNTAGESGIPFNIVPVDSPNQNYRILAVYSLTKEQLMQILAETIYPVTISSKSKQYTLDLRPFINPEVIDGLEIWIYGRTTLSDPDSYEIQVITQPKSNMVSVMGVYQRILLIAIPATILLAGILGYFLIKRMLRPVEEITRVAQNLKETDLDRKIDVRTEDELGKLAGTLNQAFERLQMSFDRERHFAAEASHELRAPLAVMQNEASVTLHRNRTPEEYRQSLETISGQIFRLSSVIRQLQTLARTDSGKEQVDFKRVNLSELLDDIALDASVLCEPKQLAFQASLPPEVFVHGDQTRLRELFLNLLDNAVRYTLPGGRITLSLSRTVENATIAVKDSGPGIPAEHLPHIFERFYRVKNASIEDDSGSGLGLAICRHIVELHRGRIEVESEVGKGSIFTVTLPLWYPQVG